LSRTQSQQLAAFWRGYSSCCCCSDCSCSCCCNGCYCCCCET